MPNTANSKVSNSHLLRADLIFIAIAIVIALALSQYLSTASAPYVSEIAINVSVSSLPGYALLSFTRSLLALFLSFLFAVLYGGLAAKSKGFEKILIPLLDVLQSLPVVVFLPGFVLALISVFQSSRWGLEFACLLTIFTGQVWNLAFAYYESRKTIKHEMEEVAKVYHLSPVQRFFYLYLPNSYSPLIFNGMISMAGGWFFLTTCEAFTLGNKSFRLPGLGSFLAETFSQELYFNFCVGLFVLVLVIVGTDFLLWRPLIVWVSRFNDKPSNEKKEVPKSLFLELVKNTHIPFMLSRVFKLILHFFFSKQGFLEEKAFRNFLLKKIDTLVDFFSFKKLGMKNTFISARKTSIMTFIITFAVGGIVFSLLPKIPALGQTMSVLKSSDWFDLMNAVLITGLKVFLVIFVSSLWTIPLGLILGLNQKLSQFFQPIIQNLAAFPAPVLFPLITLLFLKSHSPNFLISTVLMCVGSQWYILFNVIAGTAHVSNELKLVTRIYKLSTWKTFTKLYYPAILPSLVTGWITAAGGAWNASMVAELVSYPGGVMMSSGIGGEMARASAVGNYPRLIASIICIVIVLVVINRTVWHMLHEAAEKVKE